MPLLSDEDKKVAKAYGVLGPGGLLRRSIFLIDGDGVVRYRTWRCSGFATRTSATSNAPCRPSTERARADTLRPRCGRPGPAGEEIVGDGPTVVTLHGITATRRYMFHGSKALPRAGYRVVSYDARGHGESGAAPGGSGYGYPDLTADLGRVLAEQGVGRPVLVGHSMGCHTAAAYALDHADELAGAVFVGPVSLGLPPPDEVLAYWDGLADGLAESGVDGFMAAYEASLAVEGTWRETVLAHHPAAHRTAPRPAGAGGGARELPRSIPFDGLTELESLRLPALVVASRDEADPSHPYEVAAAWAESLPAREPGQRGGGGEPPRLAGGKALARGCRILRAARGLRAPALGLISGQAWPPAGSRGAGPTRCR